MGNINKTHAVQLLQYESVIAVTFPFCLVTHTQDFHKIGKKPTYSKRTLYYSPAVNPSPSLVRTEPE